MVSKMDSCMVDLVDFHSKAAPSERVDVEADATEPHLSSRASERLSRRGSREAGRGFDRKGSREAGRGFDRKGSREVGFDRKGSQGFLSSLRRSFSRGLPASR